MKRLASLILALALLVSVGIPAANAEAPTELVMWTLFSGEDGSTMSQIVDAFNASQSDVHLTHIVIDYANLMTKLALAVGDDSACPHLFVSYASDIAYFVGLNRIQPMEETLAAYPEFDFSLDRYNAACSILNMYEGKRYAALWFGRNVLPEVKGAAEQMALEDRSAMEITDEAFAAG